MVCLKSIVFLLATASTTVAQAANTPARTVLPGAYIFEFEDGHDTSEVYNKINAKGIKRLDLDYKLFKGVSVQLHDIENAHRTAAKIADLPAVKSMWPVTLIPAPNPRVEWIAGSNNGNKIATRDVNNTKADNYSPHLMTQVDKLRAQGITGKGIKVAVIDSGIDYKHSALGGCFGKGCLVSFGIDFVGDAYDGTNTPQPGPDPMDCGGHGTHVAGIVAAQPNDYGFTGAAPDVSLGAYRIFGCNGSASDDIITNAFLKAYEDGADIITASLGGPAGWPSAAQDIAVSRIVDAGVPCMVAAGNEGDQGIFYASSPASGRGITAIASFDNTETPIVLSLSSYSIDGAQTQQFAYANSDLDGWDGVELPVWTDILNTTVSGDACNPFPSNTPDLSSYIVLIHDGSNCTVEQKIQNAADKGAEYIMISNNIDRSFTIDTSAVSQVLAAGMVEKQTGEAWVTALTAGKNVVLSMTGVKKSIKQIKTIKNPITGGGVSNFSTWGPTWDVNVKPQVGAPGGNILSTYPRALGSYATLSGTSMATPLAAGIVALIAQVRKTFNPRLIENLLSATAHAQLFSDGNQFYDFLAPVPQQGGGLIQAYDAAYATTILSRSSLSFNDTDHFIKVLNFTISNTDNKQITYHLSHIPTKTVYTLGNNTTYPDVFPNEVTEAHAELKFSENKVTLLAGESATIEVFPTPPNADAKRLAVWSGFITLNGTDGSSLSLPYQGLTGSLYNQTVLGLTDAWIGNSTDTNGTVAGNITWTLPPAGNSTGADILPALVLNLTLGSPLIRADIVPLSTCSLNSTEFFGTKTIGQPSGFPLRFQSRGKQPTPWDGMLSDGKYAPAGTYKIVVRALRIFGDEKQKKDWDVSETVAFHIKYAAGNENNGEEKEEGSVDSEKE